MDQRRKGPDSDLVLLMRRLSTSTQRGEQPRLHKPLTDRPIRQWEPSAFLSAPKLRIGRVDAPARQMQPDWDVDLTEGAILVVGGFGSGKTNLLRLVEMQVRHAALPGLQVVAIDAGNGDLRHVTEHHDSGATQYCPATDVEQATVLIDRLLWELERRESGAQPNRHPVLVLIDDLGGFASLLQRSTIRHGHDWLTDLATVVARGRRMEMWAAASVQSPGDLPIEFRGAFKHVALMGSAAGEPAQAETLPPGFGRLTTGELVQVLYAGPPGGSTEEVAPGEDEEATRRALTQSLARWTARHAAGDATDQDGLPAGFLGIDQVTGESICFEPFDRHLLVVGGSRSGKTELLRAIARSIWEASGEKALFSVGRGDPPDDAWIIPIKLPALRLAAENQVGDDGPAHARKWLADLTQDLPRRLQPLPILVDDARWLSLGQALLLQHLAESGHVVLVLATDVVDASRGETHWRGQLRRDGRVVFLRPDSAQLTDDPAARVVGSALRHRPGARYRPGKTVLYDEGRQRVVWTPTADQWPTGAHQ